MAGVARRQFLIAAGGLLAAPLAPSAQPSRRPYLIGMLPDLTGAYNAWFQEAMRQFDWREGRDFALLQSGLEYGVRADEAAQRIASARPDLIFAVNTTYILAARRFTTTIPIVMWGGGYPVEAGYADSLARPGKNVTGTATYAGTSIWSKLLELLRDLRPEAKRIGVLMSYVPPANPRVETDLVYRDLRQGARRLGMSVHIVELGLAEQVDAALAGLAAAAPDAVFLTTGGGVWPVREKILRFALGRRWPTITDIRWAPDDALQPLMSYGPPPRTLIHQAVPYILRILRDGGKAADLPIQQPATFELVVNLGTAKALGLAVPQSILLRADQVIE